MCVQTLSMKMDVTIMKEGGDSTTSHRQYGYYLLPEFASRVIDRIPSFEVREDDVWIMGFPKSGTTWLQEVAYLVANDADLDKTKSKIEDRVPSLEFLYPGMEVLETMPSPRYIKTHLAFSILPDQYEQKKPKTIYIARNPKDVLVSSYFFYAKFFLKHPIDLPFDEFCKLFIDGQVSYGPWWGHVKEGWERRNDDNVLFITYEDMNMDLTATIKKITLFLEKNLIDKDIETIASHCSFEEMKHNSFVNKEWYRECGMATKRGGYFMRKGKIGDWRNHLTQDVTAQLNEIVTTHLEPLGMRFKDPCLDSDADSSCGWSAQSDSNPRPS